MICPKCGVELEEYECSRTDERKTVPHRPSQCFDALKTQLAAERARVKELEAQLTEDAKALERGRATIAEIIARGVKEKHDLAELLAAKTAEAEQEKRNAESFERLHREDMTVIREALKKAGCTIAGPQDGYALAGKVDALSAKLQRATAEAERYRAENTMLRDLVAGAVGLFVRRSLTDNSLWARRHQWANAAKAALDAASREGT